MIPFTYVEPNIMSFLRGCSKLHLPLCSGDHNAVLVEPSRERVRIQHRLDGLDVG